MQELEDSHQDFKKIASLWTEVSSLFNKIGETKNEKYVNQASTVLLELSEKEKLAMEKLHKICA